MITYSIFDDCGNLVDWYDDRAESLAAFVRFISQDASDMAWFASDEDGKIIESLVYDPLGAVPTTVRMAAPPARPRGRVLAEAKKDWDKREAAQRRPWIEDHFCDDCGDPLQACLCVCGDEDEDIPTFGIDYDQPY